MRIPRLRPTIRRLMLLTLAAAIGIRIFLEFRDGSPPRFVERGIPARIARLRPGMTRVRVRDILGLEKSWLLGGTGAKLDSGAVFVSSSVEYYHVRPPQSVGRIEITDEWTLRCTTTRRRALMIQLHFRTRRRPGTTQLIRASYIDDRTTLAEMRLPQ